MLIKLTYSHFDAYKLYVKRQELLKKGKYKKKFYENILMPKAHSGNNKKDTNHTKLVTKI